ncbi:hypothetical protein G7059_10345 [Erysipelothrix sp. HDW6A]|uniref:hypothetical protein n=1 Tax=Erysipelothrix sp. HDW6A TaxID=2714928 RepID=UPI00140BED90|nr:hypothetical protein [Erysipelothrix sp. HDW6A]QIK58216.1 hypothetical protein G7059_10345 [Erysipelothrix sp. HDW6A]
MKKRRTKKEFIDYNDYHDRPFGLKWGTAFALDELTQSIEKNKRIANRNVKELPQMTRHDIDNVLQFAFLKSKTLSIQLNDKDEYSHYHDSIIGKFEGFADESNLYIGELPLPWDSIRNVSIVK